MSEIETLPVLPLRELVLFPGITMPIAVGRSGTLKAIEAARQSGGEPLVLVLTQRENVTEVDSDGLYRLGVVARIEQVQRTLAGIQVLLGSRERARAVRVSTHPRGYLEATIRDVDEIEPADFEEPAFVALHEEVRNRAADLAKKSGLADDTVKQVLGGVDEPGRLADLVAGYIDIPSAERQALLETLSVEERLRRVLIYVQRQLELISAREDLQSKVQEELGDRQREMFLREQLKTIQKELGDDDAGDELVELEEKLAALDLSDEVRKEVDREFKRLSRVGREAMEAQVIRTFLETVTELPWSERSEESLDLVEAEKILDRDHYGLQEVKDRVLEVLAVRQLRLEAEKKRKDAAEAARAEAAASEAPSSPGSTEVSETLVGEKVEAESAAGETVTGDTDSVEVVETTSADEAATSFDPGAEPAPEEAAEKKTSEDKSPRAPILLFTGPPGVGKTSLAKSIAKSMGREYVRISLGGARDEADIRGHRRTYVGAMPGRIIKGLKEAGTKNPVFLLDEIDKLGTSFHGDPSAALLEVLDPAQNDSFTDHYMGVPFDLSEVMFICTANFVQNIPGPLLDRMETIEFTGYTEAEKLEIARQYLTPRQLEQNGLDDERIVLPEATVKRVISEYTREAGVRQLEREIGRLSRKVARKIASREVERLEIEPGMLHDLLGRPKVHPEKMSERDQIGVATAMYYTPVGGDIMFVEASAMPGKGELVLTGQLGDVMKESARAAWTYAKAHAEALHIKKEDFEQDVHIHVPAGAIPKDGPSAGVTMATALVSTLSRRPARHDLAMTGEITLNGRVLPIGGVKEKILGGVRAGIRTFVLPKDNEADLEDIPEDVREMIDVIPVAELAEVLALALRDASFRDGRLLFPDLRPEDVVPLYDMPH